MKITDLKCAVIGQNPVIRIVTDEGISGVGEVESPKSYLKSHVLYYKQFILGQDPTNVERVMLRIRKLGSFKPWGSAVSAIEMALWDLAGKAAGLPVHKLLGGKIRDKVRVYNGGVRFPMKGHSAGDYAETMRKMKEAKEGFTIIKQAVGFHAGMHTAVPNFFYGEVDSGSHYISRGLLTEKGLKHIVECVKAMKDVLGDEVGLALDCGPGWVLPSAIKFAKALESYNVMWLEDMITGDYTPYVLADVYREVTRATTTPIHTGEQIYLRQNFRELIEKHAVSIIGPDPCDIGGISELSSNGPPSTLIFTESSWLPTESSTGLLGSQLLFRCQQRCQRTT
jgi:L-alanine-DL-glutamate epimerase-like enolase superfamily enzyme